MSERLRLLLIDVIICTGSSSAYTHSLETDYYWCFVGLLKTQEQNNGNKNKRAANWPETIFEHLTWVWRLYTFMTKILKVFVAIISIELYTVVCMNLGNFDPFFKITG